MTFDIIAIAGPTASGKTDLSIAIANALDAEVVSADAFQVYCYMDIGTAKIPVKNRLNPLHHMIDICMPDKDFSVAEYKTLAEKCLNGVFRRNKKAIVVGGTPLYMTALLFDIEIPEEVKKDGLRESLLQEYRKDPSSIIKKLNEIDPDALDIIDLRNGRRLIRAIEIYMQAGVRYSDLYRRWKNRKPVYNSLNLWLYCEREELYRRIDLRVERMIQRGFVDEVKFLIENFNLGKTASQAIGYKEIADYLQGKISFENAVETIKRRTRNYAKRQISWFKNDNNFTAIDISGLSIEEAVEKILNRYLC
ncbi:MAG: tRNA (adenosine(37)-N6)-dimethylallyltransferase MiaA [Actinobacteria bacterium]|nr:tRNA (adenosine(37)-N6)-dimethylallyltransferase MiaA [Actinomycetota bacterium]